MLYNFSFQAMGTDCFLHLYTEEHERATRVAGIAITEILRIECRYSRYLPDSDLSVINHVAALGGSIELDEETVGLLEIAFASYSKSDGMFDITSGLLRKAWDFKSQRLPEQTCLNSLLPRIGLDKVVLRHATLTFAVPGMELDLGGLAKEYAADRAAEICLANGIDGGLINLGGDIRVIGPHPDGSPWRIGIQDPFDRREIAISVELLRGALATSGNYERCIEIGGHRYSHILNPKTGWSVDGLASVSVKADHCLVAGTVSTIAMLKETEGSCWLNQQNLEHLWISTDGSRGYTGSWKTAA